MNTVLPVICKYILAALMLIYMIGSFTILSADDPRRLIWEFRRQIILVILFHAVGCSTQAVIFIHKVISIPSFCSDTVKSKADSPMLWQCSDRNR